MVVGRNLVRAFGFFDRGCNRLSVEGCIGTHVENRVFALNRAVEWQIETRLVTRGRQIQIGFFGKGRVFIQTVQIDFCLNPLVANPIGVDSRLFFFLRKGKDRLSDLDRFPGQMFSPILRIAFVIGIQQQGLLENPYGFVAIRIAHVVRIGQTDQGMSVGTFSQRFRFTEKTVRLDHLFIILPRIVFGAVWPGPVRG